MTLAEITQFRTRRSRSATRPLDWMKLIRLAVWVGFVVLLVLA